MIAATLPRQRPADAKLLSVDASGFLQHLRRSDLLDLLHAGDLVVANDAATLPASLHGVHLESGRQIEVRLAGHTTTRPECASEFTAVVFGEGDFHTPTEHRPAPPHLAPGNILQFGPLAAAVKEELGHPRLIRIRFDGTLADVWRGLASMGRPIQYSYIGTALELWDTWTPIASVPVAFEAPSASFALDWKLVQSFAMRGIEFATLTHAAGISSTGDVTLDSLLPLPEPYRIPEQTAARIERARTNGNRVIALGTSVVRALEDVFLHHGSVRAGEGLATLRIGPETSLQVVDAIVSGTHEPATSHYELLQAFVNDDVLMEMTQQLERHEYRTHEFGDSIFLEVSTQKAGRSSSHSWEPSEIPALTMPQLSTCKDEVDPIRY